LLGFQHPLIFFALFFIKDRFAKTDLFRRHFNAFVLLDIFHAFLERHLFFRGDAYGIIASAGAHIGQLFPFRGVDDEIARLDMLRDDLTGIDVLARIDEEGASVLQLIDGIGPFQGLYSRNRWAMTASPAVLVSILLLKPIRPRLGISNSRCCISPLVSITWSSPFRCVTRSMTLPLNSAGTSTTRTSYGSCFLPSISFIKTCGCPTVSSKPSRRMVSMRIPRWRMPRP